MGELIRLAERRQARRDRPRTAAGVAARRVPVRPRVPVHVPGRRARRAGVRRRDVDAGLDHRAARAARWPPTRPPLAAVRAAAEERAAALRMPLVLARALPGRRAGRDARRRATRRERPRRGVRARRRPARLLRRLRPRRPRDPGRGGRGRRAGARRLPAGGRRSPPRRRDRGAGRRLLAAGADRLPALRIGRSLYWGETQVAERPPPRGCTPPRPAGAEPLRRDETGEDLLVDLLARLLRASGRRGATRNGSSRSDSARSSSRSASRICVVVLHMPEP